VAVCLALVVGYAFDAADGQLARLRGGGSPSGEWLDHMIDSAKISSLHVAVALAVHRAAGLDDRIGEAWTLVPLGFTIVAAVSFFGMILNDQLRRVHTARTGEPLPPGAPSTLRSLLVAPTDYGVLCLSFVLLGAPVAFLSVYTLLFAASAGYLALAVVKWFRDMRTLDPVRGGVMPGHPGSGPTREPPEARHAP
jgi:phosphatidylglycerophosphate synthase